MIPSRGMGGGWLRRARSRSLTAAAEGRALLLDAWASLSEACSLLTPLLPVVAFSARFRPRVAAGLVDDLDLLLAHVFLDDLDVLDDLLVDADLLLDHGPLLYNDLFLHHGNHDLFFPDLRYGGGFLPF